MVRCGPRRRGRAFAFNLLNKWFAKLEKCFTKARKDGFGKNRERVPVPYRTVFVRFGTRDGGQRASNGQASAKNMGHTQPVGHWYGVGVGWNDVWVSPTGTHVGRKRVYTSAQ